MRFFRYLTLLGLLFSLVLGGRVWGAPADVQVFREAYLQGMGDARGYHLELMFNGPSFQSNTIADGQLWKNGAAVADGKISWDYTDLPSGQTRHVELPFYAERSGGVVVMYGQRDGLWQKEDILEGFSWLFDAISSEDVATRQAYAATVTDVQSEEAGSGQQRLLITFDGKALSEVKDVTARERLSALSEADRNDALSTIRYLNAALAENNPRCTWMFDGETGETVMVTADLTQIMRSYAKAVLRDSYEGRISLSREETELLASIGYYYNLQFYLHRKKTSAKHILIPPAVRNGAPEGELLAGVNEEIISALKKD